MSSSLPVIGVTTYARDEANRFTLPSEYVDSVRRAGGLPVLIPPGEKEIDGLLASLDGILLAGGGDIAPEYYGGRHHETIYSLDPERDRTELEIAKRVIDSGMPTLAVCRGCQIVNIALGGTLHEHLPDVVGEKVLHRLPPREPTPHAVTVDAESELAGILGAVEISPASWHHQAIRDVGRGLKVVAQAEDGIVEAMELPEHPWMICVQWHPELTAADDVTQQLLFDVFVKKSTELTGRRTN